MPIHDPTDIPNQTTQAFLTQLLQRLDKLTISIEKLVEADHKHDLATQSIQIQVASLVTKLNEKDAAVSRAHSRIDDMISAQAESSKKLIWWLGTAIGSAVLGIVINATGWMK
jgi:hypothetical protein